MIPNVFFSDRPCDVPTCPPGYKVVQKRPQKTYKNKYSSRYAERFGSKTKGGTRGVKGGNNQKIKNDDNRQDVECPQYSCVSNKPPPEFPESDPCPKAECPPNYIVIFEKKSPYKMESCQRYTCRPLPPVQVVCHVTGRTFNTFDNLEYKYDICNHILARDRYANRWYISRKYFNFSILSLSIIESLLYNHYWRILP